MSAAKLIVPAALSKAELARLAAASRKARPPKAHRAAFAKLRARFRPAP
jgi:hypothetical protein